MPIIALVNQKGGCAKSTTSVHFVHWLHQKKKRVLLVDADAQRTSSIWMETLELDLPVHILDSADDVLEKLPEFEAQSDYVVVDGPAGLSEITRAILLRSHLALVPCQPTGVDLRSAADAIRLIRQAQSVRGGMPTAALFLSRATKGTRLKDEAIAILSQTGVPLLKTVIHQRQAIADTFGQSAVIWGMGKTAEESGQEFDRLFKEVMKLGQ